MTKVTETSQSSRAVMEQGTPDTQDEKMKTSCQPRSKRSVKVARVTVRVNKHIQEKVAKKASQKSPTSKKLKKTRGLKFCSQCSKVNEELSQDEPKEVTETMEGPAIPAGPVGSQ